MFERSLAISNGWGQCSIFNASSSPSIFKGIPECFRDPDAYYIVLSHPCALLNYNLESEPDFEVVKAIKIEKLDGNFTFGKNPRKLQISSEQLGFHLELEQKFRFSISREVICHDKPLLIASNPEFNRQVTTWVINRYVGSAFPDAFEERLSKSKSKIRKAFEKEVGVKCRSAYIVLNEQFLDLSDEDSYEVRLYFTLSKEDFIVYDDEFSEEEPFSAFLQRISEIFKCINGVELIEIKFLDDSKLTLRQLQNPKFCKWNYDHLSMNTQTEIDVYV